MKTLGLIDNRIEYQDLFRNTDVLLRKYYLHITKFVTLQIAIAYEILK